MPVSQMMRGYSMLDQLKEKSSRIFLPVDLIEIKLLLTSCTAAITSAPTASFLTQEVNREVEESKISLEKLKS